jgi:predicted nucleic acid-binding protein
MYLLDTNVISERRKPRPHGAVVAWVASVHAAELFLSAMTIAEIQMGIERTRENDLAKAQEIEFWLMQVIASSQILPMNTEVGRQWAKMMHRMPATLAQDAWIAATAKCHSYIVVTRNVADFAGFGVTTLNPFEYGSLLRGG